jgi:hypothetical protein
MRSLFVIAARTRRSGNASIRGSPSPRQMAHMTAMISAPASPTRRTASATAPPVVMTSSINTTRLPRTSPPSTARHVPYSLAFFLTNTVGRPEANDIAVAIGTPPSSRPARNSVSGGSIGIIAAATRRNIAGWLSKRYLSKYVCDVWPDRKRNSPRKLAIAFTSAARIRSNMLRSWHIYTVKIQQHLIHQASLPDNQIEKAQQKCRAAFIVLMRHLERPKS